MRTQVPINFNWKYMPNFDSKYAMPDFDDSDFQLIALPHNNKDLPYNYFDETDFQFISCYRKTLVLDQAQLGQRVLLTFKGIMIYSKLYVNGTVVSEKKGGYTPFTTDITDYVHFDAPNTIVVYVDSTEREDIPPHGFVVDYLTYGGIYRDAYIEYVHPMHIQYVGILPKRLSEQAYDLELALKLSQVQDQSLSLKLELFDQDETLIHKIINPITVTNGKTAVTYTLNQVKEWHVASPNLYQMKLSLCQGDQLLDQTSHRFGFRSAEFKQDGFYLNDQKLKLYGLNRHQSYPYVGYAMPSNVQRKDADLLKYELGVNTVRCSHYPQSDDFLDRCDEIGLLVFDEIPGWQHIGDEAWRNLAIQSVEEMIKKDAHHPSVVIWGVRINESQDHDAFYKQTNQLAHTLDPSRATGGVRNFTGSKAFEDVYTYNDFVHRGYNHALDEPKNIAKKTMPYLVTEHNGHMFPTKKFDHESKRLEHALRHARVLEKMYETAEISGSIGWCMFDYNTHKDFGSGDKICYHGVMDMFRIPKYASAVYASQSDHEPVMTVASSMQMGEFEASELGEVYVFTNCDYIKLFKNDRLINTFYPDTNEFVHLPHPPVIISDFIGDQIKENEKFTPKDAELVKGILLKSLKYGARLPIKYKLQMAKIFLKYKMTYSGGVDLYSKYIANWGSKSTIYRFEGYQKDQKVKTVIKTAAIVPKLHVTADSFVLHEKDTYDATRITLKAIDDYDNDLHFLNDVITLTTEGPIKIIGPKHFSLVGGSRSFWIKSIGVSGKAKINIVSEQLGSEQIEIEVIKYNLD